MGTRIGLGSGGSGRSMDNKLAVKTTNGSQVSPPLRAEYDPPRVLFREPLEAVAAVCQPIPQLKAVQTPSSCMRGLRS
jgi:hypothetical protein